MLGGVEGIGAATCTSLFGCQARTCFMPLKYRNASFLRAWRIGLNCQHSSLRLVIYCSHQSLACQLST
ncbi:hypothetical protein DUNSADRAFT_1028 [Dunaliella salina]|uniref:Uncharacterized protein n=1 Tax=Dunaliella salina TaxID=3046 RepID=A0ABQ7GXL5_DUNSA|nr:hypothetical protein DUNSADRAFT_1028 [Dunaliella salina]|eukprot:KAF5839344.1 hypothetical protein DUNSADRAFT_1028 [Dunaliella salina]